MYLCLSLGVSFCVCLPFCSVYLSLSPYGSFLVSVCLSVCLSACPSTHLSVHPPAWLTVCLFVYLPVCICLYISVCVSMRLCFGIYVSIYLDVCLPVCLSVCQHVPVVLLRCKGAAVEFCSSSFVSSYHLYFTAMRFYFIRWKTEAIT